MIKLQSHIITHRNSEVNLRLFTDLFQRIFHHFHHLSSFSPGTGHTLILLLYSLVIITPATDYFKWMNLEFAFKTTHITSDRVITRLRFLLIHYKHQSTL